MPFFTVMMHLARAIVAAAMVLVAGCSYVSGVTFELVGDPPADIDAIVRAAATSAGFSVDATPERSGRIELLLPPREDGQHSLMFSAGAYVGPYSIHVGRVHGGYTSEENAVMVATIRNLLATGLPLTGFAHSDVKLPRDLRAWFKAHPRPKPQTEAT